MTAVRKKSETSESNEATRSVELTPIAQPEASSSEEFLPAARLAMLESLSDGISHELNSPLQILTDSFHLLCEMNDSLLEIVEETSDNLDDTDKEELEFIKEQLDPSKARVRQGLDRIQDVIATFKIFAGQSNAPEREILDLGQCLRAIVAKQSDSGVAIQLSVKGDVSMHALHDDLETIVGELLSNAITATHQRWSEAPKAIKLRAEVVQGILELEVIDQGVGIPENLQSRIFDPFFSSKPDGVHRGRGLCMVDQLIRVKYQGNIQVYSRPEHGATFIVRLPIFK